MVNATAHDRTQGWRDGWYRFVSGAGGQMPVSCPAVNACGTSGPIWMDGTHPTNVGERKTVTARVSTNGNCQSNSWNIEVENK